MTTLTAREFNQDLARAKREAKKAPVIITDRGKPSHVLMTFDAYHRLHVEQVNTERSIAHALSMPELADYDMEFPKMDGFSLKPVILEK